MKRTSSFKKLKINNTLLQMVQGDLVVQEVEAIVNAANPRLVGGGGVDGRIHQIAGPELAEACAEYKEKNQLKELEVSGVMLTESFGIKKIAPSIQYIIHTVGPDCRVTAQWEEKEALLASAYMNVLDLAKERRIRTIAFPAISTGAYNYPFWEAQGVALYTIKEYLTHSEPSTFNEVRLVYLSDAEFDNALRVWEEICES